MPSEHGSNSCPRAWARAENEKKRTAAMSVRISAPCVMHTGVAVLLKKMRRRLRGGSWRSVNMRRHIATMEM